MEVTDPLHRFAMLSPIGQEGDVVQDRKDDVELLLIMVVEEDHLASHWSVSAAASFITHFLQE